MVTLMLTIKFCSPFPAPQVVAGQSIVEVKPQNVSKGKVVERILHESIAHGAAPEFVLCIGDDRSGVLRALCAVICMCAVHAAGLHTL